MASKIPNSNDKPVETVQWLTEQANLLDAQSETALKAIQTFADSIKHNKTAENIAQLETLISAQESLLARSAELRKKLWETQLGALKGQPSSSLQQSLETASQNNTPPSMLSATSGTSLSLQSSAKTAAVSSRWAGRTRGNTGALNQTVKQLNLSEPQS